MPPVTSRPEWCLRLAQRLPGMPGIQLAIKIHRVAIISFCSSWDTTSTECPANFSLSMSLKRSLVGINGYSSRDNDKLKLIGHKENHVRPDFYRRNCAVLS